MSLILEALRKSEADRQIGRAPGLLTPMATRPTRSRSGRLVLLVVAALLLAIATGSAWWLGRSGVGSSAVDPAPVATGGANAPAAQREDRATLDPTPIEPTPIATPSGPAPAPRTPAPTVAPPAPPLPAAGPSDLPSDPDFVSTERESVPLPPPAPVQPVPIRSAEPTAQTPAEPDAAGVPAAVPEPEWTTRLATLGEAERAGLPPLKLNMHVFNEEPSRRFVIIDGRRLEEGDRISAEVSLLEVRRDGALLDLRGRRVLIERP